MLSAQLGTCAEQSFCIILHLSSTRRASCFTHATSLCCTICEHRYWTNCCALHVLFVRTEFRFLRKRHAYLRRIRWYYTKRRDVPCEQYFQNIFTFRWASGMSQGIRAMSFVASSEISRLWIVNLSKSCRNFRTKIYECCQIKSYRNEEDEEWLHVGGDLNR